MGISAEEQKVFLEGVKISEVMSSPPRTIGPDQTMQDAARAMAEHKIGCLPVVEGKEIVGILTETDVLRYFASL
jgi:CBS domain-containing protein